MLKTAAQIAYLTLKKIAAQPPLPVTKPNPVAPVPADTSNRAGAAHMSNLVRDTRNMMEGFGITPSAPANAKLPEAPAGSVDTSNRAGAQAASAASATAQAHSPSAVLAGNQEAIRQAGINRGMQEQPRRDVPYRQPETPGTPGSLLDYLNKNVKAPPAGGWAPVNPNPSPAQYSVATDSRMQRGYEPPDRLMEHYTDPAGLAPSKAPNPRGSAPKGLDPSNPVDRYLMQGSSDIPEKDRAAIANAAGKPLGTEGMGQFLHAPNKEENRPMYSLEEPGKYKAPDYQDPIVGMHMGDVAWMQRSDRAADNRLLSRRPSPSAPSPLSDPNSYAYRKAYAEALRKNQAGNMQQPTLPTQAEWERDKELMRRGLTFGYSPVNQLTDAYYHHFSVTLNPAQ